MTQTSSYIMKDTVSYELKLSKQQKKLLYDEMISKSKNRWQTTWKFIKTETVKIDNKKKSAVPMYY